MTRAKNKRRARRPYDPARLAHGSIAHHKNCTRTDIRVMIGFDPETFQQIRRFAINQKQMFAAAVRELVETGLEEHGVEADDREEL